MDKLLELQTECPKGNKREHPHASETAVLWQAVGGIPLGRALEEMSSRGWTYTAAIHGTVAGAMMVRGNRRATLYTSRNRRNVGMIYVFESR